MDSRGHTLAEILIATLLLASTVSMVAGVFLSGAGQSGRAFRREEAALAAQGLLEELGNFVTADPGTPSEGPAGSWAFPGEDGGTWALEAGTHDASARLPSSLRERSGRLTYAVTVEESGGLPLRRVEVRVDWNES